MKEENFIIIKNFLLDLEKLSFEFAKYFEEINIENIKKEDEELGQILQKLKKTFFLYFNDYYKNFTLNNSLESFLISEFNENNNLFSVLEKVFDKLNANIDFLENYLTNLNKPQISKLKEFDFISFKINKQRELISKLEKFSNSKEKNSSTLKKNCKKKFEELY